MTIAGAPARVGSDNRFEGVVPVTSGTNVFAIAAVDASGNVQTQQYQVDTAGPSRTFAYDANGNMINDGVRTFDWDGQDRLVAINKATHRTEFTYNELGERVVQKDFESSVLGQERRSIWLDGRIAEERDASGLVLRRRLPFGDVIGGASYFVTQDHLDSTRETTDGAATVHARYDYDPYGRSTTVFSDIDQPRGYSGGEVGSDGTVFAYRRAYDPELGRWLSEDPIGLAGGANLYEYVAGNPIRYVDPSGLRMTCSMTMARTKYKQAKTPCNKPGCTYADYAATWTECQETPCCGWKFDADVKLRVSVSYTVSKQESEYESHDTPGVSLAGHEALHVGDWRTWCALINGKFKTEGFKTKAECDKGQEWVREMGKGPFRSESREHDHPR